jgi:CheY-like chemotaxis protein
VVLIVLNKKAFRVLVVDDDEDDRFFITSAMSKCGIKPPDMYFAEDGDEAMSLLKEMEGDGNLPDLMLLDLNMPRMNGHEVLKRLKEDKMLSRISVVILTTSESEKDILEAYAEGGHSFITKPNSFNRFVDIMRCLKDYMDCTIQPSDVRSF